MNNQFSRILTLLRTEKKISQKAVAIDLGISQALLSHYEKGIRECGLDFLVSVAEYYKVSTDFLLGRTTEKNGCAVSTIEVAEDLNVAKDQSTKVSLLPTMKKKTLINSIDIIYDLLTIAKNRELTIECSNQLYFAIYKVFAEIYTINENNPKSLFASDVDLINEYCSAYTSISQAKLKSILGKAKSSKFRKIKIDEEMLYLDSSVLEKKYPLSANSLFSLLQQVETSMNFRKK